MKHIDIVEEHLVEHDDIYAVRYLVVTQRLLTHPLVEELVYRYRLVTFVPQLDTMLVVRGDTNITSRFSCPQAHAVDLPAPASLASQRMLS